MSLMVTINKTIKYAQKRGGKLTESQLWERLISDKKYNRELIDKFLIKNPQISSKIIKNDDQKIMIDKMNKAIRLAKAIEKKFKDIMFIGVTGSVAAGYPKNEDDIDLMIITKVNKLWINRLELRLYVAINKIPHRRFGKQEMANEFCFNLWLDEKAIKLDKEKQNLNNAVDLILMRPLINKNGTYEKFIKMNDWAENYVATGYEKKIKDLRFKIYDLRNKQNFWDIVINWIVFWPQFWFMKEKIKKEKIKLNQAFFHR